MRKLIALALVGAGIAAVLKKRAEATTSSPEPSAAASGPAGGDQAAGAAPAGGDRPAGAQPEAAAPPPAAPEDLAEVRSGQTEATIQAPIPGAGGDEEAVVPDVSDEDTVVREQEEAARTEAGSIGGAPDAATADTDPSMRPVYEGSGDAPETFEATEDQGR